ncbi:unnamed protein product [Allacma fusca]|uniref:Ectopic P granules protein 5 homolog n=1 Tax=Allacma fusca TaxID=39272 RepID=A0A8J2JSG7_9HEXA|nr:unnamed protein product [Allacma fusca]
MDFFKKIAPILLGQRLTMEAPLKTKKKSKRKESSRNITKVANVTSEETVATLETDVLEVQIPPVKEVTSVVEVKDNCKSYIEPLQEEHDIAEIEIDLTGKCVQNGHESVDFEEEASSPELLSIISPIQSIQSSSIVEETGKAMQFDLEETKPFEELIKNVEVCREALESSPTAPANVDSGDFFSLQSMKQSLDNVNVFKTLSQVVEEDNTLYDMVLPRRPLEASRISHLYSNFLLENKEEAVSSFLSKVQSSYPNFELYELLNNYSRVCNQLSGCEKSLLSLKDQCEDFEKQVWTVSSKSITKEGTCEDQNIVTGMYQYHTAHLNNTVVCQLNKVLKDLKELLKDSFPLYVYSVQLCKAQIDHFFYKSFHHINLQDFGIQGYHAAYPSYEIQSDAELLKLSISTLFQFIRKPQMHPQFAKDCQNWLNQSVGLLLRIATLEDHMFILNHVIRSPPGTISKWASKFVQVPALPVPAYPDEYVATSFGHLHLDYSLTVLSCILNSVPKREEFLKQHVIAQKNIGVPDSSLQWVVVDSDGEDDLGDSSCFKESDVVALLHQVPFESIFARALFVCQRDDGYVYNGRIATEHSLLKLIAFCNQLVDILGDGFATYTDDRYRRLIKLLGRLILHTAHYVTDHLDQVTKVDPLVNSLVTMEYNLFLLRTVKILLRGRSIGTLQFLASIPFNLVSIEMLWEIYALLTYWNMYDGNEMKSEDVPSDFEEQLVSMNESDAFYLLTTMNSMAIAREGKDNGFVRIVTIHLFQIGFLSPLTRESCSKQARDLLGSLTNKFPHLISVLIQSIKPKMDILENMSLYLLKELAFSSWRPTEIDVNILSNWLLNFNPTSLENQMGRFIIQSMCWTFDDTGQLFLSVGVHRKVAILVVESHLKWEKTQSILSEGVKQVTGMRFPEINFSNWGWEVIKRLHLHVYDQVNDGNIRLTKFLRNLPTFEGHSELEPLRKSVEDKHPLGSFVTLLMTPWGHCLPVIASKGFDLMDTLISNYRIEPLVQTLFFITPLFANSKETVAELKSKRFLSIISSLLASDMTYVRMAKSLVSSEFPGAVTKLVGEMIESQLQQCQRLETEERKIVRMWTELLTGCENWNKDYNILYLLDILARFSFYHEECRTYFYGFFIDLYKKIPSEIGAGITSYLFSWSATSASSLLPNPSYPQMPYLMYFILHIEMQFENLTGFWKSICHSLAHPKVTVDSAVKKANASCNFSGSVNFLSLYRFAQQALDVPLECPLALVFWQKFFLRFFHRISADESYQGGVGDRYFEGLINSAFLKKLKRRIHDLVEYHQTSLNGLSDALIENKLDNNYAANPTVMVEFWKNRLMLANAMSLWIEELQLHKDSLYLPALPPQFLPSKLLLLMEGSNEDWSDYIDFEVISHSSFTSVKSYLSSICRIVWVEPHRVVRSPEWIFAPGNSEEEILKRLKTYDSPIAPPGVPVFAQVLPVPSPPMYADINSMNSGLKPHFSHLTEFARSFALQISQHTALDCAYLEFLPDLYTLHDTEAVINVRCSGTRKWEPCSGPAPILFKYKEARLNERIGHQIQLNRTEYHSLIDQKSVQPPPEFVCVSAVFIEDFITNLVLCHRSQDAQRNEQLKVFKVGKELFYHILSLMNDECNFYPPTRQLFSSFVEILGAQFVANDPFQYKKLVSICIRNPQVVGAVAPHINLVNSDAKSLIDIYETVANICKRNPDLAFVILSKLDLNAWLIKSRPSVAERTKLIAIMWKVITSEGISPDDSSPIVYSVFRTHLKKLLLYEFPLHYGDILKLLLVGSEEQVVPLEIWYDFFHALSNCKVTFSQGRSYDIRVAEMKRFAYESCVLQPALIVETVNVLSNHFTKERLAIGLYGLYPKYKPYMEPLSCFLQMISHAVIVFNLKTLSIQPISQTIAEVWSLLCDLYSPWILPYDQKMIQHQCSNWIQQLNFDSTSVLHPWISVDAQSASIFVDNFSEALVFFADNLPGASGLLSELLNFYLNHYAQPGVKDHVVCIVNNSFINLIPWKVFWPSLNDLEGMNKVVEKYLPAAHSFLGCIFVQINWTELANDGVSRELSLWGDVTERAFKMKWDCVPVNSLESVLNWFVMSVDPRVVLTYPNSHAMETASLLLLKIASGYIDSSLENIQVPESSPDLNKKRYLFVRTYVRLLVSVASKFKNYLQTEVKNIEKSVQKMLTEMVNVVKFEEQTQAELMQPLKELFVLMSNHYLGTLTRNAFIEWCEMNKEVPLTVLLCLIRCCWDSKVPAYTTVPLIETAINLCFQHQEATWDSISEVSLVSTNIAELGTYFEVAYRDGHYLVLYCLFLRRFDSLTQGGVSTISFLMDVLKNLKPKETNEAALPLLYEIILKLNVHLLFSAKKGSTVEKNVKKFLNTLSLHMANLGDDKGGWGLLGALGIGQSSKLSVRGRLFCRCLSIFIQAQLPVNSSVRLESVDAGHFNMDSSNIKPHQDVGNNIEKLQGLKLVRQYLDYTECIDAALSYITDESHCLSLADIETYIEKLSGYLFTETFLIKENHHPHSSQKHSSLDVIYYKRIVTLVQKRCENIFALVSFPSSVAKCLSAHNEASVPCLEKFRGGRIESVRTVALFWGKKDPTDPKSPRKKKKSETPILSGYDSKVTLCFCTTKHPEIFKSGLFAGEYYTVQFSCGSVVAADDLLIPCRNTGYWFRQHEKSYGDHCTREKVKIYLNHGILTCSSPSSPCYYLQKSQERHVARSSAAEERKEQQL